MKTYDISDKNLREPFERIDTKIKHALTGSSDEDPILYLEKAIKKFIEDEPYKSLKEKLYPLYGWRKEFGQRMDEVLSSVAKSLETGKIDLDCIALKKANQLKVELLARNLSRWRCIMGV